MPAPEAVASARAVREVLGTLQAPALRGVLMIEGALAGVLAALAQAPLAATFDPLARPAGAAAPARAAPSGSRSAHQRHAGTAGTASGAAPRANAGPAGALAAGAGTSLGAALGGALGTDAQRTSAVLDGIAAAVAALGGPLRPTARTPEPAAATARGTVLAAAGMTGAALRTADRVLDAVPGASAVAPVLGGIGALADALWWRTALMPPAADASQPPTTSPAPRRSPRPPAGAPAARDDGTGGAESCLPAQAQAALGTLGEIVTALYAQAARAGAPQTPPGQRPSPAPRAPSVLVGPCGAATPASREASTPATPPEPSRPAGAPGTPGVAISVDADALARALRAEGLLRGVDL